MLAYLIKDGASSRKYALEAFYLLCQTNSLLSPQASHRLIWNRFYQGVPALAINKDIMDNFDWMCVISTRSGAHTSHSTDGDLCKIVKELVEYKALHYQNGQT